MEQLSLFDMSPVKYYLYVLPVPESSEKLTWWYVAGSYESKSKAIEAGKKLHALDFAVEFEETWVYQDNYIRSKFRHWK